MKIAILCFLTIFISSGCANYIGKMHREFDRADGKRRAPRKFRGDKFDFYRKNPNSPQKGLVGSNQKRVMLPTVKRAYRPEERVKADDLTDSGSSGSLWVGEDGDNSFLFTNNNKKSNGDIVLINVKAKLKNLITAELKRAFPERRKPKKKKEGDGAAAPAGGGGAAAAEAPAAGGGEGEAKGDEVFDRISSIVIEEINKDHLLLRGRKFLLYKNHKRLIELQALVPRRTITNTDEVDSSEIIESNISVVR